MPATAPLTLRKHIRITGTLTCRSGLRIGGSGEEMEIGGMDNPIIRDPLTKLPYIPGSSLKGKLRSLLEYKHGKVQSDGRPCGCARVDCPVCTIFGPHFRPEHSLGPSRILVRDALLTEESRVALERLREDGLNYAEVKAENWIDRRTGIAGRGGLRRQERVPQGTKFEMEIVLRVFEGDDEQWLIANLRDALDLLEKEALGGSGSRGYGWVKVDYTVVDS